MAMEQMTGMAAGRKQHQGEGAAGDDPRWAAIVARDRRADGTFFYSSPKYPSAFRLNQILEGGLVGMTVCTRGSNIQIGREDGDLNFLADVYVSGRHATVEEREGKYYLTDLDSRNGTYVRIKAERPLSHGDYVFIGRRLLRVELNAN